MHLKPRAQRFAHRRGLVGAAGDHLVQRVEGLAPQRRGVLADRGHLGVDAETRLGVVEADNR